MQLQRKFKYDLKNERKHYHCSLCQEEKLKWNLDRHFNVWKKLSMQKKKEDCFY